MTSHAKRSNARAYAPAARVGVHSAAYWSHGILLTLSAAASPAFSATLPVPCLAGSCGKNVSGFVTSGTANAQQTGKTLTINNLSNSAVLNWSSFDVSADGKVVFVQPSSTSVALNQIYQANPSSILGSVSANGQIYLVNPNGFVFGANSTINVGGLLASSLSISSDVFSKGILSPGLSSTVPPTPSLDAKGQTVVLDGQGNPVLGADGKPIPVQIVVQPGAQMTAASGGRLMLASQSVQNGGSLSAPDGQVVLAAGQQVYLQASTDPNYRGILVEVDSGGKAWNQLTGSLSAPRGNVSMVGMAVNQDGRISATTVVSANGSVTLVAADTITASQQNQTISITPTKGGNLELGPQSTIDIQPELSSTATAVTAQTQMPSLVTLQGQQIVMNSGASITAPGGTVTATALANPTLGIVDPNSAAQLRIDAGASIDVSGSTAQLSVADNIVAVQLNAAQLANNPANRDGFLHGQTVYVDSRVVESNGAQGTAVADVSSAIAAVPHNVAYRTTQGGTVKLESEGDVVVAKGASINVSGGQTDYSGAVVATTQLIGANGQTYDIGKASADMTYVGLVNPTYTQTYTGWGVTTTGSTPGTGKYQSGYIQGAAAGTVQIAGTNIVLNGNLTGKAYNGPYQRTQSTFNPGGQLIIGLPTPLTNNSNGTADYLAPAVQFVTDAPQFSIPDGTAFPGQQTLDLPVSYLTQGGFTRTQIFSNQSVTLPAGLPLNLAPESIFQLSAPRIAVESSITDPSGTLNFVTANTIYDPSGDNPQRQGIDVGQGVVLDVRGLWTNDLLTAQGGAQPSDPIALNGGTIGLSLAGGTGGELSLGDGSALHASGGAWLAANGSLTGGAGGTISLSAGGFHDALQIGSNVGLDAYGVQTALGGAFNLTTNRIEISQGDGWSGGPQLVDQLNAPGVLQLSSGLFSQLGFASVNLTATGPAAQVSATSNVLTVDPGVLIQAQESNLLLGKQYAATRSGASVLGFAKVATLPDYLRPAESLSLAYTPTSLTSTPNAGEILISPSANISVDPMGSIELSSGGSVDIEGTLRAPGGTISVLIPALTSITAPLIGQGILLGSNAILDAGGTSIYQPDNGTGIKLGSVLGGGSVLLVAVDGNVTTDSGSQINVAGISAPLDVIDSSGAYSLQTVSTAGGNVSMSSSATIQLRGSIDAAAGTGGTSRAAGGSLSIALTSAGVPEASRTIEVSTEPASTVPGSNGNGNGTTVLSASYLEGTGAAQLTLSANYNPNLQPGAAIQIDPGVSLSMSQSITLDAPVIAMTGGAATLKAPAVTFTNTSKIDPGVSAGTGGTGTLNVLGNFIDLAGIQAFQGVGSANFNSSGDVRLDSLIYQESAGQQYLGGLDFGGNLTIDAARVYATTTSNYTLTSTAAQGVVTIGQATTASGQAIASPGAPLSVGGEVTINADQIVNAGSLYAPFGQINLNAGSALTLAAGSITSVSGNGLVIPYGNTQNSAWIYQGVNISGIPTRQVSLTGPSVTVASGATVDLTGGGDLYASEFVPGSGGTVDVLLNGQVKGLYAVLPQLEGQYAPYDVAAFAGSGLAPGESVYLSGIAGLPAGVYPLLPASYALLPGAFLVQAVANSAGKIAPGAPQVLPNGTSEVAGYLTFGNTGLGDPLYSGFVVDPGSYISKLATYQGTYASQFFSQAAAQAGLPTPALPADAGALFLNVTSAAQSQSQLTLAGQVLAQGAKGGAGADIQISAADIDVVADAQSETLPGYVQVAASVVQSWDAGRLLIGGQRGSNPNSIIVSADNVTVSSGATLSAHDVELVAGSSIDVQSGATIASTSGLNAAAAPATLPVETTVTLSGPSAGTAALLSVSDAELAVTSRPGSGTSGGTVTLESGGSLKSAGAISVEGPGAITLDGSMSAAGASVSLTTGTIRFGADPGGATDGLTINSGLLANLGQSRALRLAGANAIDVLSDTTLGSTASLASLTLIAPEIDAAPGVNATFGAKSLTLEGLGDGTATAAGGTGNLTFAANTMTVEPGTIGTPGTLALNGFGSTTAQVSGALVGAGSGGLLFGGDAAITVAAITGSIPLTDNSGADIAPTTPILTLAAPNGKLSLLSSGTSTAGLSTALGTQVVLSAASIDDQTSIIAPSGAVTITAKNDLSIGPTAVIDTSGRIVTIAGQTASSQGGMIALNAGGNLSVAAQAQLDVGGAPNADAGSLTITGAGVVTLNGSLSGAATGGARGGIFSVDAGQLSGSYDALAAAVQAGGFTTGQSYRVRTGDLVLDSGNTITANQVQLVADTGSIRVGGTISAPSADLRGSVDLFAGQNVEILASGQLHADSTGARGGSIEIGTTQGQITLDSGSVISALGTQQNGTLTLRAPAVGNDVAVGSLAGVNLSGLSQVFVEPVLKTVLSTDPTSTTYLDSGTMSGIEAATAAYMANASGAISTRLAAPSSTQLTVEAAVDIETAGAITGNDALDLTSWRFGTNAAPVDLTVRAGGSIEVSAGIVDGQQPGLPVVNNSIDVSPGPSSSINLVAGADLKSANPTGTLGGALADLTFDPGVIVTTGTGNITLAAARNVVFGAGATAYTTGLPGVPTTAFANNKFSFTAPTSGGNVAVRAGQDVVGSQLSTGVFDWQVRQVAGGVAEWGVDLSRFDQFADNVATLGGGDLSVLAGGNVNTVSAAAAGSRVVLTPAGGGTATPVILPSGGLVVRAGGNITSGSQFFLADGTGTITAGGSVGTTQAAGNAGPALGVLLGQQNSRLSVTAGGDLLLAGDVNPTVVPQASVPIRNASAFFSYGDLSALSLTSVSGSLDIESGNEASLVDDTDSRQDHLALPPSLSAAAFVGDLTTGGYLAASPQGQLALFAGRDLSTAALIMSDAPPGSYPTIQSPTVNFSGNAGAPLEAFGAIHSGDPLPVQIAAGRDITGFFQLPKQAEITAGRDIINFTLKGQNLSASDTTLISAGRDFIQPPGSNSANTITVGGPGAVDLFAGRDVNLGSSLGVTTTGRLNDAAIADANGASISIWAGLGVQPDVSGFINKVVAPSTTLQASLIAFVEQQTGSTGLSYSQAQTAFLALPFVKQQPFVADTFFGQLLASGLAASTANAGYAQGYAAIDALFPASRLPPGSTATSPYAGDLGLPFSSIYTLAGGAISLLVPGGLIDVGLSNPPAGQFNRPASELGIVAQNTGDVRIYSSGDVNVNNSRIFALDGGNIQIWSDEGSIDGGLGSKTAISAPPPQVIVDASGNVTLDFAGSVAGSGIRTVLTEPDANPGNVYLTAPVGTVDAGDAGIVSAGAIYVSAAHVIVGNGGFSAGGAEVGVPPAVTGLGAALSGASSTAASSTNVGASSVGEKTQAQETNAPLTQTTLSWLDVFVEGFGSDTCKADDAECLKRNAAH